MAMGDPSEAPSSLFSEPVYFPDDQWDSASPWHGERSPPATQSSGTVAQGHSHNDQPSHPLQNQNLDVHELPPNHNLFQNSRLASYPPHASPNIWDEIPFSSPNTWDAGTPSPQIIPEEIVFPSPSTPSDISWNVLLSSDSESHVPPTDRQPSRQGRQPALSTSQMSSSQQTSGVFVDLTQETSTPPRTRMPSTSSHRGPNKRRRIEPDASIQPSRRNPPRRGEKHEDVLPDVEEVDLRDVDDDKGLLKVLEDQRMATIKSQQEQASKPVKLATLSCVICMESMTDVTATYCGHLFCHKCLMEALIAGENQGSEPGKGPSKCPVCRKRIKRPGTTKREVGQVVALEVKVKKRDDKGKNKAPRGIRNPGIAVVVSD